MRFREKKKNGLLDVAKTWSGDSWDWQFSENIKCFFLFLKQGSDQFIEY